MEQSHKINKNQKKLVTDKNSFTVSDIDSYRDLAYSPHSQMLDLAEKACREQTL